MLRTEKGVADHSANSSRVLTQTGSDVQPRSYTKLTSNEDRSGLTAWIGVSTSEGSRAKYVAVTFSMFEIMPDDGGRRRVTVEFNADNEATVEILKEIRRFEKARIRFLLRILEPPKFAFRGHFSETHIDECSLETVETNNDYHKWVIVADVVTTDRIK